MIKSQRIEFIDLAKGICILLVVAGHCGFPIEIPGYEIVRMPLYFTLSGLFFKDYGGKINFLYKKTNKLLIPFLFFYLLGCIFYYTLKWLSPNMLITASTGILDLFNNRQFFNGPIWFLLCLFWCNIIFYLIHSFAKSNKTKLLFTILCGFIGWYLGYCDIFVPLFIDVALTALPLFAFGYFLKRSNILIKNKYDHYNLIFAVILWAISYILYLTTTHRLSLHYNKVEGWSTFLIAISSVLSILLLCKSIKHVPIISYLGRYSIVLLCVHHLINRPLTVAFSKLPFISSYKIEVLTFSTILISAICIPIFKRYLPWFIAQKDLIKR